MNRKIQSTRCLFTYLPPPPSARFHHSHEPSKETPPHGPTSLVARLLKPSNQAALRTCLPRPTPTKVARESSRYVKIHKISSPPRDKHQTSRLQKPSPPFPPPREGSYHRAAQAVPLLLPPTAFARCSLRQPSLARGTALQSPPSNTPPSADNQPAHETFAKVCCFSLEDLQERFPPLLPLPLARLLACRAPPSPRHLQRYDAGLSLLASLPLASSPSAPAHCTPTYPRPRSWPRH